MTARLTGTRAESLLMTAYFTIASSGIAPVYVLRPDQLFGDARLYFRATGAWVAGGNPWAVDNGGILFAAPPPALLLNLPLLPFGEWAAVAFWVVANAVAVVWLLRRLGLAPHWLLFYPVVEGFTSASPDLTLAAIVLVGGGALAAATKPYSVPALLAAGRWRAAIAGGAIVALTVPLLPWPAFLASGAASTLVGQAVPNSAWGLPVLTVVTAIALLSLGPRRALALAVPAIIGQQPHYALFSLRWIAASPLMTIGVAWPARGAAAVGAIAYAVAERVGYPRNWSDMTALRTLSAPPES